MSDIHRRLKRQLLPGSTDSEKAGRGMLAFRSRKLEFSNARTSEEKGILGTRKRESDDTREDAYLSPRKSKAPGPPLPQKYALLEAFYEGVEAAISLLGIRRQLCTFQSVCATVEATTKRRFLLRHLAQIKYILPEAIELEYVRSYDSDTRSKKCELKISLLPMPAEAEEPPCEAEKCLAVKKPKIETVQRRRAFHARLAKFASTHPEEDDVPEYPLPERAFNGNSAAPKSESAMPAATTCIPMEINMTAHRVEVPESDSGAYTHFSRSFRPSFSSSKGLKAAANDTSSGAAAPVGFGVSDTILPMPINRTPHRDVHTMAKMPLGTPHLAPSFRPFFSVKRSLPEAELGRENCNDADTSVQLTPMKRRRAGPEEEEEEEPEIVQPVELSTPIRIVRAGRRPEFETPTNKRPHFSPSFKPHFSARQDETMSSPSREPRHTQNAVDHCSPIEEASCAGLQTPIKSSVSGKGYSPSKHQCAPCTPLVSECGERTIYVSCHEGFKSPAPTPVKQPSTIRSLNFATPKGDSQSKDSGITGSPKASPCCSPGVDVPGTPGMQTPVNPSRASRFRNREATKQTSKLNLGPLFAQSGDETLREDAGCMERAEVGLSSGCLTADVARVQSSERSSAFASSAPVSGTPSLRKSLSFASEVSHADLSMIQGLPAELVHSVMKEELKVAEERSKDTVALRRRQQMMAGLPHLFNQLRLIFQSSNKSVFPYKELLSKVLSSNTEMTDRIEVEERLKMLMELAPEWISVKTSLTGDLLYRVDKKADVMSVRKRLCGVQS